MLQTLQIQLRTLSALDLTKYFIYKYIVFCMMEEAKSHTDIKPSRMLVTYERIFIIRSEREGVSPSGPGVWLVETVCACAAQRDTTGRKPSKPCHTTWVLSAPPSSQNQPAGLEETEGGGHRYTGNWPRSHNANERVRKMCLVSKEFPFHFIKRALPLTWVKRSHAHQRASSKWRLTNIPKTGNAFSAFQKISKI